MKIAILTGGRSGEHDVSLETGRAVSGAVAELGYEAFELVLGRDGGARWSAGADSGGEGGVGAGLAALEAWSPDAAFIAMHGRDGEDGRVQGALEVLGVPYQGSGVAASALAMDKPRSKGLYRATGVPVARDRVLGREACDSGFRWDAVAADLGLPLVLKTSHSGSSVGVEIVDDLPSLRVRGPAMLAGDPSLLVEEYVAGVELTCPVLEDLDGTPGRSRWWRSAPARRGSSTTRPSTTPRLWTRSARRPSTRPWPRRCAGWACSATPRSDAGTTAEPT